MIDNKTKKGDYVICLAVFIQSVLILLQQILIDVFGMDPDATTTYRVALTAIPMVAAIIVGFYRKTARFVFVYVMTILILLLTVSIFPKNEQYVRYEAIRFLLPLVVPSTLCLITVKSLEILETSLIIIAWTSAVLVLFYIISYFAGRFFIDSYNMSFSYGCLLPMIVLFSRRKPISTIFSFVMFLAVLAIGSRGGAIIFVAYVLLDVMMNKRKGRWIILIIGLVFVASIPILMSFFDSIGISSRTIGMLNSGDISNDTGRNSIYQICIEALLNNPFFGVGMYGDRVIIGGVYCHNFFLEVFLDFGLLLGIFIVLILLHIFIRAFSISSGKSRTLLLILTFACFFPYMASGSYLISNSIAIWLGYILLIINGIEQKC